MKHWGRLLALIGCLFAWTVNVWAQTPPPMEFVPGEMVLTVHGGILLETARGMADSINADLITIPVPDTYLLRLRGTTGLSEAELKQKTLDAVDRLRADKKVLYLRPNYIFKRHDTIPNDPLYGQQWALPMINMPKAWDIEKGKSSVKVAFIDDNFDVDHPDLQGRFDLNLARDFRTNPPGNNPRPRPGAGFSHGTGTSSCVVANNNNGIGIAAPCWEGVQVVPLAASDFGGFAFATLVAAATYVRDNAAEIDVLNMSLGGYFNDPQFEQVLQECRNLGVVIVASAGNDALDTTRLPSYPAGYSFVIAVSALGPNKTLSSYSNYGKIELTAPGGDIVSRLDQGVLVAAVGNNYEFTQGTSFSGPYVAAACAMLLSAGTRQTEVQSILQQTADPLGTRPPSPEYGWGLINVFGALRNAGVFVLIDAPDQGETFQTQRIQIKAEIIRSNPNTIQVLIDDQSQQFTLTPDPNDPNRVAVSLTASLSRGSHKVVVSATAANDETITGQDTRTFSVRPFTQFGGLTLFSVPYEVTQNWEELFGIDFAVARWITDEGMPTGGYYARYFGQGERNALASTHPPDATARPDGTNTPTPPRGIGYFLSLPPDTQTSISIDQLADFNGAYLVPLKTGWNMVGNPFPFSVDWNACEVEIVGTGGLLTERMSVQEAVNRKLVRGQLYRYISITGDYSWQTAPLGQLLPWSAHWVRALKPCTLVVPPLGTRSRSTTEDSTVAANVPGGWMMRLIARSNNREDRNNFIGISAQGNDQVSQEDVEKPPVYQSFVNLRILPKEGGRSALAQDIRRNARKPQKWDVEVTTDQPNAEVTLQWAQEVHLPRGTRVTMVDTLTGQRVTMNKQSSYQFRMEGGTSRRFTVEAQPASRNRLMITNVNISSTRGNGHTLRYSLTDQADVRVEVQNLSGKTLARLSGGTRSAGANTVSWNGRTDEGISLPAGTYHVQVIATTEDGETVRVVRPVVLTR
jgi:hypothetical protein